MGNAWEFSTFLGHLKPPSPVKKMLLWGNSQSPSSHKAGYLLWGMVMLPCPPLSSHTWNHHLGVLLFPWATSVGSNCICWQKAIFEDVFSPVLPLPAPFMLTQNLFGLHLRGPRNSCVTSNTSSTPVLIILSKGH